MTDREVLNEIKTIFIEKMRIHPKYRGLNAKLMWRDLERAISVEALRAPYQRFNAPVRQRERVRVLREAAMKICVTRFGDAFGRIGSYYPHLNDEDEHELLRIVKESIVEAFPDAQLGRAAAQTDGPVPGGNPIPVDELDIGKQTTHHKQGVIAMSQSLRLAAEHLRILAKEMEARSPSEETELSRKELDEWKRLFMKVVKKDPRNRGRDVEKMWRDWQRCIPENIGEIVCSSRRRG